MLQLGSDQTVRASAAAVMSPTGVMAALTDPDFTGGGGAGACKGCGPFGPYSLRQSPVTVVLFLCWTSGPWKPCSAAFSGIGSSKFAATGPAGPAAAGAGAGLLDLRWVTVVLFLCWTS